MKIKRIEDVFIDLLSDTYSAEKQLIRGLSKLASEASDQKLSSAFKSHLEETKHQIERLDQVIGQEKKIKLKRKKCIAMESLIDEAKEIINSTEKNEIRDTALIAAAQKVEHYEMASYGTLRTLAKKLGYENAVHLFEQTLQEEKKADTKLTRIALKNIPNIAQSRA